MDSESTLTIDEFGNKRWINTKGEFHRLDGPAREFENGHKEWWFNGVIHREDGSAAISPSGGTLMVFLMKQKKIGLMLFQMKQRQSVCLARIS